MADNTERNTYVRETQTPASSSGTGMAIIVGGLVVAVGFILWLVFANPTATTTSAPAAGGDTNVTIENAAPATEPAQSVPATEPAASEAAAPDAAAPAEPAPAANN